MITEQALPWPVERVLDEVSNTGNTYTWTLRFMYEQKHQQSHSHTHRPSS